MDHPLEISFLCVFLGEASEIKHLKEWKSKVDFSTWKAKSGWFMPLFLRNQVMEKDIQQK